MKIHLLRTAYPRKVDYNRICRVRKNLEKENKSSQEKIKEIFSEIGLDIDFDSYI